MQLCLTITLTHTYVSILIAIDNNYEQCMCVGYMSIFMSDMKLSWVCQTCLNYPILCDILRIRHLKN